MQKRPKKCFATMDEYLASRALYRKTMARDASSLFRAVSEQLYHSQSYHQKIRQDCANFIRANRCKFEPFVEGSFDKYLERLEDPKETVGQLEIKALSLLYRLRFVIYLYPGQPPKVITEDGFTDKVILCCSNSGHYDIVYHRSFLTSAAICQSILYELLYTRVFGVDEAELHQAMDAFQDRRYRNRLSAISHGDMSYELPEDRSHKEEAEAGGAGAAAEDKARAGTDDSKPPAEPSSSTLILPYKVLKSLDTILYRNVEFDVWLDSCKDGLETDYMVFAARQYFVGDQCQVRLEPKGKYYKALIEDVGTLAVTVFIEELGEKHFVPLTNVKPVNPVNTVPARNIPALSWKGDLDSESRGQRRHRRRYFRKAQGGGGLLPLPSSYVQAALPPLFQPAGHTQPPPPSSAGAMTYDPSSTHFLNQHLIGPQLAFYDPVRQYYHIYDNYAFCSRCSQRQLAAALNKDCQFGFSAETGEEEPADLEGNITYDQLDDANEAVFPPLPGQAVAPPPKLGVPPPSPPPPPAYWVQRGPGPLPPTPPPRKPPVTSSEEDQEDASTVEDQNPGFQSPVVSTAAEPVTSLAVEEGGAAESPTDGQQGQAVAPPPKLGAPPPPPPASSYWVQRGPGPLPPTSTVEDQTDYSEFYIYKAQDPGFQSPVVSTAAEPVTSLAVEEGGAAESPTDGQKGQAVAPPPKLGAPPPPPPASSYWVQRGPGPLPPTSTVEDQNPGFQSPVVSTAAEPVTSLAVEEGGAAESPTDGQKGQAVAPPPKLGAPPPPPPASSYWVQRGPGPLPPTSTVEDQNPGFQSPVVSTAAEPVTSLAVEEGGAAESPTDGQQGQAVAPPPKLGAPPPPPPASSYWVQRGPGPLPPTSTVEDQNPGFQSPVVSTAAEPVTSLAVEEGGAAESPTDGQKGQAVAPPPKLGAPPPPPPASSYWVQRGPGPLPPTSTVEDQTDYSEFYIYKAQDPGFQSPVVSTAAEPVTSLAVEEGGAAESPTDGQKKMEVQHSYCADNCSAKKRWSSRQPSSAFVPPLPPSHPPPPHLTLLWPHTSQCQHTASHAQLPWRCQPRLPGWLMSWASLCAPWWLRPLTPTTPTAATYPESCRRETTWSLQPGSTSWETSVSGATRAAGSWPTHPPHLRRPTPTRPTPTTTPPPPRMHRSTAPPSPWKSPPPPPPSSVVCLQAPPPRHSSTRSSPSPLPPLSCTSHMKPRLHSTSLPPLLFLLLTPTSPITPPTTLTSPLPPSPLRSHQEALTTGPTHGSTSPPLTPPTWLVTSQPRPLTTQPLTTFHRACDPASMCRNMLTLLFSCQPIREGAGLCRRGLILCLFMENISVQYSNG
ncbi:putative bifunctional UDP-N-acetylglucosamine transferase and deubiquitinase ALG13 isoform X40 [Myripristis murdjan]|uniref:putative bifunctional UDP-N-acetylglucosamine transferase and deubiquitinase ALG13 isoform X40 n=1 Tax=Myripristis murdjan TaxID=586833 RepID=UPI0011762D52|nr:putative bifunctional UDP-N-acetylglucosamine transferase and deubiquitinase ALG13 isoform X40 [Myripristis murdjan]